MAHFQPAPGDSIVAPAIQKALSSVHPDDTAPEPDLPTPTQPHLSAAGVSVPDELLDDQPAGLSENRPQPRTGQVWEVASPPPADTKDGAGQNSAALQELAERIGGMAGQLAEFHRRSEHRESIIDRLHQENQQLRAGLARAVLEPVVADLIRLYDQVDREVRRLKTHGQDARLLWSFADDIAQILDRCGIEIYLAEPGDAFDRDRHRPLAVVACTDESRHNTVAEVFAVGFTDRETGRVRRPAQARFHQYTPAAEPMQNDGTGPSE